MFEKMFKKGSKKTSVSINDIDEYKRAQIEELYDYDDMKPTDIATELKVDIKVVRRVIDLLDKKNRRQGNYREESSETSRKIEELKQQMEVIELQTRIEGLKSGLEIEKEMKKLELEQKRLEIQQQREEMYDVDMDGDPDSQIIQLLTKVLGKNNTNDSPKTVVTTSQDTAPATPGTSQPNNYDINDIDIIRYVKELPPIQKAALKAKSDEQIKEMILERVPDLPNDKIELAIAELRNG